MTDGDSGEDDASGTAGLQRLDKWLWFARVVKTRTLAAGLVTDGRVRVNRERIVKPSQALRPGDVVTVAVGPRVRVLEVLAPGARRGPPAEAQGLYRDLTPPREPRDQVDGPPAGREAGSGRPTKRDRRALDRLKPGGE
jgi:ribosome-associated heat shock protein Hsp15